MGTNIVPLDNENGCFKALLCSAVFLHGQHYFPQTWLTINIKRTFTLGSSLATKEREGALEFPGPVAGDGEEAPPPWTFKIIAARLCFAVCLLPRDAGLEKK